MTTHLSSPRHRGLAAAAVGVVLLAAAVIAVQLLTGRGPDREDPAAVADAFARAYAGGEQQTCELATEDFLAELQARGRCGGRSSGDASPQVLFAKPCTTRALAGVAWHGQELGAPYALLDMARTGEGEWAVDSVTPLSDRQAVQPGRCEPEGAA